MRVKQFIDNFGGMENELKVRNLRKKQLLEENKYLEALVTTKIANKLIDFKKKKRAEGMFQKEVAEQELGVDEFFYSKVVNGSKDRSITLDKLIGILYRIRIPIEEVFNYEEFDEALADFSK